MIQKIMPSPLVAKPMRSMLKAGERALRVLPGSSMSGWHGPSFQPTEMIIPGGLDFKEKAYFLLKGNLPKSVYERWIPNDGTHVGSEGDQLVTVNLSDHYVGSIVENPHDYVSGSVGAEHITPIDTSNGGVVNDIANTLTGSAHVGDDDGGLSTFEIFKHLAGFQ